MPDRKMSVTVLGAGSWGTTVASLVAKKNDATVWGRDDDQMVEIRDDHKNSKYLADYDLPANLHGTSDLEEAVTGAHVLVVGVPSHAFRSTLEAAKPFVHPWIPVVSLTKGLEADSLMRMTEVIKDVLPGRPAAALSGPNLAKEIMAGQAAASVIATEDLEVAEALQDVFQQGLFRVYTNHDVIGCEMGGALKNVIAISAGMAEGLSVGDNTRSAVITRGLSELSRLGQAMGGEAATFAGLAGLGDLVATCVSKQSRNRYVGEQLGQGRPLQDILDEMNMVAEGVKTAGSVMTLGERHGVDLPICREVHKVITGEITGDVAYRGLFRTRAGHEAEPG
jgi:glycerol-3-phosphate dehydrogenase (NAD(P)+)